MLGARAGAHGNAARTTMGYRGVQRITSWGFVRARETPRYTVEAPAGTHMRCSEIPRYIAGYHVGARV